MLHDSDSDPMPVARCVPAGLLRIALALALAAAANASAQDFKEFDSSRLPGSEGISVRVTHPAGWRRVPVDDGEVLAELRGPQGPVTGILQVGRGQHRDDMDAVCQPGRAVDMLQKLADEEPATRVTDVFARRVEGRPAFEIRYVRKDAAGFLAVRSVMVCLKDTRVLVSCGGVAARASALADMEPVCRQVLDSIRISEH